MAAILFYTLGYPGAGKTTLAKNLVGQLRAQHIHGDRIGYELFTHPRFTPDEVQIVRTTMEQQSAQALAQNTSVIYDAMLHTRAMRQRLLEIARAQNKHAIGLWVQLPEQTARRRAAMVRVADFANNYMRTVPKAIFDKHVAAFEAPHSDDMIIRIWGTASFPMQYSSLRKQLRDLGIAIS